MKSRVIILAFIITDIILLLYLLIHGKNVQLLNPAGQIAAGERHLLLVMISIMLLVGLPIIGFLYFVAWKYREGNTKSIYDPNGKHNKLFELLWWGIPLSLVIILGTMTWNATHQLDPYRSLNSSVKPLEVQVVSLQWKWLFIYPDYNIATVNFLEFPVNTPVEFHLTSDAPMNSFWIPQLSGQIYAMTGMDTQLHIQTPNVGDYNGSAAEISGAGFSGMRFTARAASQQAFESWVESVQTSSHPLTNSIYENLVKPSENTPPVYYSSVEKNLFQSIIMKYMAPTQGAGQHMIMK